MILEHEITLVGHKGSRQCRALFDSGSSYSIVRADIAREIATLTVLPTHALLWECQPVTPIALCFHIIFSLVVSSMLAQKGNLGTSRHWRDFAPLGY